jgi:hypothetical protein
MLNTSERELVESYLKRLQDATAKQKQIQEEMNRVEVAIRGMLALTENEEEMKYLEQLDEILKPEGFTEAIRKVLRSTKEYLTPAEVKERLPIAGFFLTEYSNPLASIHTILKRLHKANEVTLGAKDGKASYQWRPKGLLAAVTEHGRV